MLAGFMGSARRFAVRLNFALTPQTLLIKGFLKSKNNSRKRQIVRNCVDRSGDETMTHAITAAMSQNTCMSHARRFHPSRPLGSCPAVAITSSCPAPMARYRGVFAPPKQVSPQTKVTQHGGPF
jgi:deoxyxylulose-5-phosphate synthase